MISEALNPANYATISHDLYHTMTDFVSGAEPGKDIEGKSVMLLLTGQGNMPDRELYWYYPHYSPQVKQPAAAVRDGQYKLTHFYDPVRTELYDLSTDRSEEYDLAEKMPAKRKELRQKLQCWLDESGAVIHTLNPDYRKG